MKSSGKKELNLGKKKFKTNLQIKQFILGFEPQYNLELL